MEEKDPVVVKAKEKGKAKVSLPKEKDLAFHHHIPEAKVSSLARA